MSRRFIVVNGFYEKPDDVRGRALAMPYREPADLVGWRTGPWVARGTRDRIQSIVGAKIVEWGTTGAYRHSNGVFFLSLSAGTRRERPHVHYDGPLNSLTGIVYLTPEAPPDTGTSFWRHRETGLEAEPTREDARRLGSSIAKLERQLERDSAHFDRWIEVDRVGNIFNRALFFCPNVLHSATRHFGRGRRDGRMYHCFHFRVRPIAV